MALSPVRHPGDSEIEGAASLVSLRLPDALPYLCSRQSGSIAQDDREDNHLALPLYEQNDGFAGFHLGHLVPEFLDV